jgi:hypothetical protein
MGGEREVGRKKGRREGGGLASSDKRMERKAFAAFIAIGVDISFDEHC